jgi:hypothetical protein
MDLVTERFINYIDLKNGNLSLYDCALISDAMMIKWENQFRINQYVSNSNGRKS